MQQRTRLDLVANDYNVTEVSYRVVSQKIAETKNSRHCFHHGAHHNNKHLHIPFLSCTEPDPAFCSICSASIRGVISNCMRLKLSSASLRWLLGTADSSLLAFLVNESFADLISLSAKPTLRVLMFIFADSMLFWISLISLLLIGSPYLSRDSGSELTLVPADEGAFNRLSATALWMLIGVFNSRNDDNTTAIDLKVDL